jgi:glycosyltransferase involved in cell wall biosynthesis
VAPGSAPALAATLGDLADDPGQRARLAAAAADDVRARFSTEHLIERTQALYDELLSR